MPRSLREENEELQRQLAASQRECEELRARVAELETSVLPALMPPQPAVEHAQPQLQGRQRQRNDEVLDDRPGKRARKALEGEKFREKLVDVIPPTGLALAQLGRDQFPTEIIQDGNQIQEVLARDGPMRRFRVGLFRDGKPIKGEEINGANGLQLRVELRYAGRTIATAEWLHAHDPEHNRNGKQVSDVATLRDHEVAIPISIKALSSDSKLFPGASKQHHVPLTLAVVVDAAAHGGETFGVAEALTRPFISKAKADSARKRIDGAPRAAHADGAFRNFTGTADLAGTAVVGGPPVQRWRLRRQADGPLRRGRPRAGTLATRCRRSSTTMRSCRRPRYRAPTPAPAVGDGGGERSRSAGAVARHHWRYTAQLRRGRHRGVGGRSERRLAPSRRRRTRRRRRRRPRSAAPDPTTRNDGKRRGARRSGRRGGVSEGRRGAKGEEIKRITTAAASPRLS